MKKDSQMAAINKQIRSKPTIIGNHETFMA